MADAPEHRNEVVLVGRVTSVPVERVLPSGDNICSWRLTVDRGDTDGRFDVVDCTAWSARARRAAASWQHHDVVEVEGALRRRFYRTGGGTSSVYEIEVSRARRVAAAVRRRRTRE
jgi:single-strand DNA-binding protein